MARNMDLLGSNNTQPDQNMTKTGGTLPFREFDSSKLIILDIGSTSRGNQRKYKTITGDFYIKDRFLYHDVIWKDHLVEVVASKYAASCNFPPDFKVVRQGICTVDGIVASYSEAFDRDGCAFIAYSRAMGDRLEDLQLLRYTADDWFKFIFETYSEFTQRDEGEYLALMTLLDLVIGNEDRHLSNFGYLRREGEPLQHGVLFDFGLGLFEANDSVFPGIDFRRALKHVRMKPWMAKATVVLDRLERDYSSLISSVLPAAINLEDYEFPSTLAREYFSWINERLGVKVDP